MLVCAEMLELRPGGIELIQHDPAPDFTKAFDQFPAFGLEAIDCLLKLFGRARLGIALDRLYADDDYVAVHSRRRRFLIELGMDDFESRLDLRRFVRTPCSRIMNMDCAASTKWFNATQLQIETRYGAKLIASRTRTRHFRGLAI